MIEKMALTDQGEPCSLASCPPGLFRVGSGLGLKTEYGMISGRPIAGGGVVFEMTNRPDAYVVESGEAWWGGTSNHEDRAAQIVQPVSMIDTALQEGE